MIYIRVEIVSESGYSDPRSSVGDTPHGNVRREVQPKEEGVKFCDGPPKRVANLGVRKRINTSDWHEKVTERLTAMTEVAPLELIRFITSARMVLAVALCASLNP